MRRIYRFVFTNVGNYPTIIGEIGIPYDMDNKAAYQSGDYSSQIDAFDANLCALEKEMLSFTIWNYCPDNSNQWGDQWNGEDLSIWCSDGQLRSHNELHLDFGGRALLGFVRPFPILTPGTPKCLNYNLKQRTLKYVFAHEKSRGSDKSFETELFIPNIQFPDNIDVWVSSGVYSYDKDNQRLTWTCGCKSGSISSSEAENESEADGTVHHKILVRDIHSIDTRSIHEAAHAVESEGMCPSCSIM
jgi:hypothetical protein